MQMMKHALTAGIRATEIKNHDKNQKKKHKKQTKKEKNIGTINAGVPVGGGTGEERTRGGSEERLRRVEVGRVKGKTRKIQTLPQ